MDLGDILFYILVIILVALFGIMCWLLYGDTFNPFQYQNETATIDSITKHDMYYEYDLNVSGSKIHVKSVNYYNLSDKLDVLVQRGSSSGCIVNTVFVNGIV